MSNIKDISECIKWRNELTNPSKTSMHSIQNICAKFIRHDNSNPVYRAKIPIRSYKITNNDKTRDVLTTVITPAGVEFTIEGVSIRSEKVIVERQRFCYENIFDRFLSGPDKTTSPSYATYTTGDVAYPGRFMEGNGIYSTDTIHSPVNSCFSSFPDTW